LKYTLKKALKHTFTNQSNTYGHSHELWPGPNRRTHVHLLLWTFEIECWNCKRWTTSSSFT